MPEIRVTRELPVPLTDEEKATLGSKLCAHLAEQDAISNEKAKHVAACNEKLKVVRKAILRTRASIETGEELRDVQCVERSGLTNGTVDIVRLDTGEIVETITDDPARAQDVAQQELPITRPGKACEYCGNADGTHRADVSHGHAVAILNADARGDVDAEEEIIPLTAAQRDGLEERLEMNGSIAVEYEGQSYTILRLADDEERDNGADAIALLTEEDLDVAAEDMHEMADVAAKATAKKGGKGGKGKKNAEATP